MLELSAVLAMVAAVCMGFQALAVEYGLGAAESESGSTVPFIAAFVTVIVSMFIFWGVFIATGVPSNFTVPNLLPFVVVGILNPAAFRLIYFEGINRVGARIAAIILATYPAIASIIAIVTLGEQITIGLGLGIGAIVVGGMALQATQSSSDTADQGDLDLIVREIQEATVRDISIPIIASVILAISYVLVRYGLEQYPEPIAATTIAQSAAFLIFVGMFISSKNIRRDMLNLERTATWAFVGAGLFVAVFWLSQFFALRFGSVVTVIPLVSTFPLVVIAASYTWERRFPRSPQVIFGVLLIITGAILVQTV